MKSLRRMTRHLQCVETLCSRRDWCEVRQRDGEMTARMEDKVGPFSWVPWGAAATRADLFLFPQIIVRCGGSGDCCFGQTEYYV
jgi:hypothetical protein